MTRLTLIKNKIENGAGLIRLAHPQRIQSRSNGFRLYRSLKFSGVSSLNGRVSYKHLGGSLVGVARQSPSFSRSQLKYIEWPSFTTTLKTATLSLFLVAVFIVVLSSVDSALCYILNLILRKAP